MGLVGRHNSSRKKKVINDLIGILSEEHKNDSCLKMKIFHFKKKNRIRFIEDILWMSGLF